MSDDAARRALAELARGASGPDGTDRGPSVVRDDERSFRETIERATAAVDDVEAAAEFVETVGLDELERAVERARRSVSGCADDGQRALDAFRDFRSAAAGDQFHSGRGTSLGGADIGPSK